MRKPFAVFYGAPDNECTQSSVSPDDDTYDVVSDPRKMQ